VPQRRTALLTLSRSRRSSGGRAWREADYEATDLETVIRDLLTGQYSNPIRVVAFNTAERWSEDVSEDNARELRRRSYLQMRELPSTISISSKGTRTAIGVS
jgi:hypothetical protein